MSTITPRKIRWGANVVPPTYVRVPHVELGLLDVRSNWCRPNWWPWWSLEQHAQWAKSIMAGGGRVVEVLVDRQPVIPPFDNGDAQRMAIAIAIATWQRPHLDALKRDVQAVRDSMPDGGAADKSWLYDPAGFEAWRTRVGAAPPEWDGAALHELGKLMIWAVTQ